MQEKLVNQALDECPVLLDVGASVLLGITTDPGFSDLHAIGRDIESRAIYAVASPAPVEQKPSTVEADEPFVFNLTRNVAALQGLGFCVGERPGEPQIFS